MAETKRSFEQALEELEVDYVPGRPCIEAGEHIEPINDRFLGLLIPYPNPGLAIVTVDFVLR